MQMVAMNVTSALGLPQRLKGRLVTLRYQHIIILDYSSVIMNG